MNQVIEYKEKKYKEKINKKKYSLQFLPKMLENISNQKIVIYKGQKIKSSYLIDIVHNLILKYYFKKDNSFNLSAVILKEKYGSWYNYYIEYLVEMGAIQLTRNYQKGKNARIYKLSDKILKGEISRYKNSDKFLLKKYVNAISIVDENPSKLKNAIDPEVKKKLVDDLFSVQIDYTKSIFFLDATNQDIDVYNKNKYSVECIRDNHIFYHFDDYGRMHTNFTILKSFIRKNCLLIDNEETVEIDIKNSQPLFLSKLIEENDIFIVDENEFKLFKALTINGNFYQYLIDNSYKKITKKEIKEVVYKVLFGKNYKNKSDDLFKRLFPTIYAFIKSYKKEMGNYRHLSYSLQRAESNLIFNRIIKKIMTLYPEIKVVTVHDSIICSRKYKDIVEIIFNTIINEEFNIDI
jgi:hypothetical protein